MVRQGKGNTLFVLILEKEQTGVYSAYLCNGRSHSGQTHDRTVRHGQSD